MPDSTKIVLSADELELVKDSEWILTKRAIIDKAIALFNDLLPSFKNIIDQNKDRLPYEAITISPKISRGENYKGLPYVVLDYPRYFSGENIFAIRTMFWWGNFFSLTLHLSGKHAEKFREETENKIMMLDSSQDHIGIHRDQWQHHFEQDNYQRISGIGKDELLKIISGKAFIKIARRFPVAQWNEIKTPLLLSFEKMIDLVKY